MDTETADCEIRARLAANDASALEMIWDCYSSDLLGYLAALHCSRYDAEDTLQEVFVAVAQKRSIVARARFLKPYLFRLARNLALNRIKREKRMRERLERLACDDWLAPDSPEPETADRARQLAAALAALPERQRPVVVLKFYRGMTLREIGELLGVSGNTAASCLRYAIEKLRNFMTEPLT